MIMDQEAVRALALMGRVMAEEILVRDSMAIRADIRIKVIKVTEVAIIIRAISSSSSRVTRAT